MQSVFTVLWVYKFAQFIVVLSLLKLYFFSRHFTPCRHFWSVVFMSCNFMPCNFDGLSFSRPAFSVNPVHGSRR